MSSERIEDIVYDLLYIGDKEMYNEAKADVLKTFPEARILDASDDVHRYRFDVNPKTATRAEWLLFLFRSGWFESSLMYQFDSMNDPESIKPLMKQVIDERKAAK